MFKLNKTIIPKDCNSPSQFSKIVTAINNAHMLPRPNPSCPLRAAHSILHYSSHCACRRWLRCLQFNRRYNNPLPCQSVSPTEYITYIDARLMLLLFCTNYTQTPRNWMGFLDANRSECEAKQKTTHRNKLNTKHTKIMCLMSSHIMYPKIWRTSTTLGFKIYCRNNAFNSSFAAHCKTNELARWRVF